MASGYRPPRSGADGLAAKFAEIYRRLDALSAAAGVKSAVIRGKYLTVQDDDGNNLAQFGVIPITTTDPVSGDQVPDHLLGSQYRNTDGSLIMTAGRSELLDLTAFQVGDIDNLMNVAVVRIFSDDVAINSNDFDLNNSGDIDLTAGGHIGLGSGTGTYIQHSTTGSGANAFIDVSGLVMRSTSSQRYKVDIADADIDPGDVLSLRPRTWVDKGAVDRAEPGDIRRHVGLIAEELDELPSMRQFVNYDDDGRPDSIEEARLPVALLELCKAQQAQIEALTERLDAIEAQSSSST